MISFGAQMRRFEKRLSGLWALRQNATFCDETYQLELSTLLISQNVQHQTSCRISGEALVATDGQIGSVVVDRAGDMFRVVLMRALTEKDEQ